MEYFDCTRDCKYCVAKLCEKRGNYVKGEATNTLQIKHKHNKNGKEI